MNRSQYRKCVVPQCTSNAQSNPKKLLIHVPIQEDVRSKWLKLAGSKPDQFATKTSIYFCEDHFDLEKDMENYMKYKLMGFVKKVVLRKGCLPTKFHCQNNSNINMASAEKMPESPSMKRPRLSSPSQGVVPLVPPVEEEVEEASTDTLVESWSSLSCEMENTVYIKEEAESTGSPENTDDNDYLSGDTVTIKVEPDFPIDVNEGLLGQEMDEKTRRERKLQKNRERQKRFRDRQRLKQESLEQLALNKRLLRECETIEVANRRRLQNAERARRLRARRRANESEEEAKARRARVAEQVRRWRARKLNESEEEVIARRARVAEQVRSWRARHANETEEEANARRARVAEQVRSWRVKQANETEEEVIARRARIAERVLNWRAKQLYESQNHDTYI